MLPHGRSRLTKLSNAPPVHPAAFTYVNTRAGTGGKLFRLG